MTQQQPTGGQPAGLTPAGHHQHFVHQPMPYNPYNAHQLYYHNYGPFFPQVSCFTTTKSTFNCSWFVFVISALNDNVWLFVISYVCFDVNLRILFSSILCCIFTADIANSRAECKTLATGSAAIQQLLCSAAR